MKTGRPRRPLAERLTGRVVVDFKTGCWLWIGNTNKHGYGIVQQGGLEGGMRLRAHRAVYELLVGPIPDGLTLDHLCRVRHCVNPAHLEPVTRGENVRRGEPAQRTHCPLGHEYNAANTYYRPSGARVCRHCARIRNRTNKARWRRRAATT